MSISSKIASHLPYLRRFGRALTGSQQSGDAYVVAVLESFIANPRAFPEHDDPRVALYRCFIKIWNSIEVNRHAEDIDAEGDSAGRILGALTPLPRLAFLLVTVEGFTASEVATILDLPEGEVAALLNQAGREIAEQVATDVLIIEDEPMIALDLEHLIQDLGHRVIGVARTHSEAVKAVQHARPGLVLADIQLADGSSGLDAVNEILLYFDVPVIFITAFPERLLTGEKPEPTFLITKPYGTDMVRAVVSQALFFGTQARLKGQSGALMSSLSLN